jgi:hypothetical protein
MRGRGGSRFANRGGQRGGGPPVGGPAPPPLVAPDAISGLALWTDPSDVATHNGGAGGAVFTSLADKAAGVGGRVAGQQYWAGPAGTEATTTTIGGRTAMLFNGSNQYAILRTTVNGLTSQRMHNSVPGVSADGLVINSESVTVIAVVEPLDGLVAAGAASTYGALQGIYDLASGYGPAAYIYGTAATANFGLRIYKFTHPAIAPANGDHWVNDPANPGLPALPATITGPVASIWRQEDPGLAPGASFLYGGIDLAAALQTTTSQVYRSYSTYWKTRPMYLGYGYSSYSNCKVGEFCVWNRSLSDAEVQSLQPYFNLQWGV